LIITIFDQTLIDFHGFWA